MSLCEKIFQACIGVQIGAHMKNKLFYGLFLVYAVMVVFILFVKIGRASCRERVLTSV